MRVAQAVFHPGSRVELACSERREHRFAADQGAAAVGLEPDGLESLVLGSAVVDERPAQPGWAVDLDVAAVEGMVLPVGRALHKAIAAADTQVDLAEHQHVAPRAPPVAKVLGLRPHIEDQARRRGDEPPECDRGPVRRQLDLQLAAGHERSSLDCSSSRYSSSRPKLRSQNSR